MFCSGKSEEHEYAVSLKFYKEVDNEADESKYVVHKRNIQFHIMKKEKENEFWPRLLEDKAKKTNIKIDWDKYVDEDEEDGGFDMSALSGGSGFDFSQMMQQPMSADAPNDEDEPDSDDEGKCVCVCVCL